MTEQDNQPQDTTSAQGDIVEAVRELVDMMNEGGIGELKLKSGEFKVHLRTEAVALAANTPAVNMHQASAPNWAPFSGSTPTAADSAPPVAASEPAVEPAKEGHVVTSPMIGTYYSASAPGEPAFVQVGDDVETGQTIGIIEAMKIMNEITADKSGVVVEILVENSEAVEYGTPLVRISNSARLD